MTAEPTEPARPEPEITPARQIRIPGFIREETGLGDAIKRVTNTMGIRPCGPCAERAARLNSRIVLTPWGRR